MKEQLIKSGWRDAVKERCRKIVQDQGLDNINADEIIKQVTPFARCKCLAQFTMYTLTNEIF